MTSHPPLPCQRTSSDFDRECHGVFRVLHDKGLGLDCTHDRPEVRGMNAVSERPLRWLWQDKIPLGKLTLIEGPPAVGKLFVALDIAARVSTGALCGDYKMVSRLDLPPQDGPPEPAAGSAPAPGSGICENSVSPPPAHPEPPAEISHPVVLVCDSWHAEDMIASRLRTLGADREQIATFTGVNSTDSCGGHKHSRKISFPLDARMFHYILREHRGCRLVVIDNLENYCDSPRQFRQAIKELDELAIYFDIAIIATVQGNVRFSCDGTIRDTARTNDGTARCIWSLTPDAARPGLLRLEPKRMAFCKKPEGIACRISDAGQVVWEPLPLYEKPPTEAARRKKQEQSRMRTWLETTLGTEVVRAKTIYDAGRELGFSKNGLIAAREELGARTVKIGFGKSGNWLWTLKPESEINAAELELASFGLPTDYFDDLKEQVENEFPDELEDEELQDEEEEENGLDDDEEDEPDELESSIREQEHVGRESADQKAHGQGETGAAQKTENSGVLSKNGQKIDGSESPSAGRKGAAPKPSRPSLLELLKTHNTPEMWDGEMEKETADKEGQGRSETSAAQESENSGVLNKNGGEVHGSGASSTNRKPPLRGPGSDLPKASAMNLGGLTTAQLRELGMKKLGLLPLPRAGARKGEKRPVGNGHSGHGSGGHGSGGNGKKS